jgi:hypothetical protein
MCGRVWRNVRVQYVCSMSPRCVVPDEMKI